MDCRRIRIAISALAKKQEELSPSTLLRGPYAVLLILILKDENEFGLFNTSLIYFTTFVLQVNKKTPISYSLNKSTNQMLSWRIRLTSGFPKREVSTPNLTWKLSNSPFSINLGFTALIFTSFSPGANILSGWIGPPMDRGKIKCQIYWHMPSISYRIILVWRRRKKASLLENGSKFTKTF